MYIFFHLITGLVLGFLAGDLSKDRRWIVPCALGSVLPDIIDKPLGLLTLGNSLYYGRSYTHGLLAFSIIILLGCVYWYYYRNPAVVALAVGIFSHQALDLMWDEPSNWYYPFLGPFYSSGHDELLWNALAGEIFNPVEIVLFVLVLLMSVLYLRRDRILPYLRQNRKPVRDLLGLGVFAFVFLAFVTFTMIVKPTTIAPLGWSTPGDFFVGSVVLALTACLFFRWRNKFLPDYVAE